MTEHAMTESVADLLDRARRAAVSTRDRQLLTIVAAYRAGQTDLADALIRDHLTEET